MLEYSSRSIVVSAQTTMPSIFYIMPFVIAAFTVYISSGFIQHKT